MLQSKPLQFPLYITNKVIFGIIEFYVLYNHLISGLIIKKWFEFCHIVFIKENKTHKSLVYVTNIVKYFKPFQICVLYFCMLI
jgi:hypothetical protein